mmetsp:Transcript_635/g.1320  ORF Transcript_635/g.1320 Transcript_635/m.1320 type:complete len:274 (+) Transcript_635:1281-2102(+)
MLASCSPHSSNAAFAWSYSLRLAFAPSWHAATETRVASISSSSAATDPCPEDTSSTSLLNSMPSNFNFFSTADALVSASLSSFLATFTPFSMSFNRSSRALRKLTACPSKDAAFFRATTPASFADAAFASASASWPSATSSLVSRAAAVVWLSLSLSSATSSFFKSRASATVACWAAPFSNAFKLLATCPSLSAEAASSLVASDSWVSLASEEPMPCELPPVMVPDGSTTSPSSVTHFLCTFGSCATLRAVSRLSHTILSPNAYSIAARTSWS